MAQQSDRFHEPLERLSEETLDRHRALVSLQEELEAVDWYAQRADATRDEELRSILRHNMEEEIEHAAMVLEWLRRRSPKLHGELSKRLFRDGPIAVEDREEDGAAGAGPGDGSLGLGSLRDVAGEEVAP